VRAERFVRVATCALVLHGCARDAREPNASLIEVRASMNVAAPLGDCLPRALGTLGSADDLGRVAVQSVRYLGPLDTEGPTLQRHEVRFFQSQNEAGPRLYDALVLERRCRDGTIQIKVTAVPEGVEKRTDPRTIEPRLDALLAHVRTTCGATPLAAEPAHTLNMSRENCAD
jgi:hypothetical protein